jgi:hypothetical protein
MNKEGEADNGKKYINRGQWRSGNAGLSEQLRLLEFWIDAWKIAFNLNNEN